MRLSTINFIETLLKVLNELNFRMLKGSSFHIETYNQNITNALSCVAYTRDIIRTTQNAGIKEKSCKHLFEIHNLNEQLLYFTADNFTLLQKTLLHEKYFFLQNLNQLEFLLAFEN